MKYTYSVVRASYSGSKAYQERHDIIARVFSRPLSFPVAWFALQLGLRPNHVTAASIVVNVIGMILMATGDRGIMAAGVTVVMFALVLDCADGNMARTLKMFSPMGEWLEGVGAYLVTAGFQLAGGYGAWRALVKGDPVTDWPLNPAEGGMLIAWGALAAASITVSTLAAAKLSVAFPQADRSQIVARQGGGLYGTLFTIGRNLSFASGLVLPATLVGILVRRYELVLGIYAILNVGMLLSVLVRCWQVASRSHRAQ
jgi:hypothetical protein